MPFGYHENSYIPATTNKLISGVPMDSKLLLATLMKKVGTFGMSTFESRLIFQKSVYFLQRFGIKLGYSFSWYIYGPYSSELTDVGFELAPKVGEIEEIELDSETQSKLDSFLSFLGGKKDDSKWLEALASEHFLRTVLYMPKEEVIEFVKKKQPYFEDKMCREAWKKLEEIELVS